MSRNIENELKDIRSRLEDLESDVYELSEYVDEDNFDDEEKEIRSPRVIKFIETVRKILTKHGVDDVSRNLEDVDAYDDALKELGLSYADETRLML